MAHDEKRSSTEEIGEDLSGGGGSAWELGTPGGGGGYPDIYNHSEPPLGGSQKIARDPRLDELSKMGLPRVWLEVAELIGYQAFMEMWHTLSSHADDAGDSRRVRVPCYSLFTRYQRNRYIQSLAGKMPADAIRKHIKTELGEDLSYRQVLRLIPS